MSVKIPVFQDARLVGCRSILRMILVDLKETPALATTLPSLSTLFVDDYSLGDTERRQFIIDKLEEVCN